MREEDIAASDGGAEGGKSRSSATSCGRKLRIKIKLPERSCEGSKMEDVVMRNKRDRVEEEEEEVCTLCGKGFRSRKALGGHMRVHAQRERSDELKTGVDLAAACSSDMDDEDEEEELKSACDVLQVVDGEKPVCPICGRDFPSNKALFGHMRCHPERKWRGIQPPVYSSSSTVSDVEARNSWDKSDDDVNDDGDGNCKEDEEDGNNHDAMDSKKSVVDLEKDLLNFGWRVKGMRGREATVKSSPAGFGDMAESIAPDQAAGVQSLILLSRGGVVKKHTLPAGPGVRDSNNFIKKLKLSGAQVLSAESTRGRVDHDSGNREERKRKWKNPQVLSAEEVNGLTNSANKKFKFANEVGAAGIQDMMKSDVMDAPSAAEVMQTETKKIHKVRKYLMVNDLKAMSANLLPQSSHLHQVGIKPCDNGRYKCSACNKSFSSHQALGGHMSNHNKLRNAHGGFRNDVTAQGMHHNLGLIPVHPLHQCNVCFKIYPTGQALGGHKRTHCPSLISKAPPLLLLLPPELAAPSHPLPPPAAPEARASDESCKFDLNELPPLEDDEDQTGVIQPVDNNGAAEPQQEAGDHVHMPHSPPASA